MNMIENEALASKKIIFVLGGVMSGLGKGALVSSANLISQDLGVKSLMQKADPYLNIGAGLINPSEHGEVFVCKDGSETDLDLGNYMRITGVALTKDSSFTAGHIYKEVIEGGERGVYKGETIQVVPHVTDAIKKRCIDYLLKHENYEALFVEIGGTIGDIESGSFLESVRQIKEELKENAMVMVVSYIPRMNITEEWKTKPTQHSILSLRSKGINPDVIACRSENKVPKEVLCKVATTCGLKTKNVISMHDCNSLYETPVMLNKSGLREIMASFFCRDIGENFGKIREFENLIEKNKTKNSKAKILIVGKYALMKESYKSLYEALEHSGIKLNCDVEITSLMSENFKNIKGQILEADGVIIPGGFGFRGWEEKKATVALCYENNIPCVGICFGLQAMICALADKFLGDGKPTYTSEEFVDESKGDKLAFLRRDCKTLRIGEKSTKLYDLENEFMDYEDGYSKEIFRHGYYANRDLVKILAEKNIIKHVAKCEKDDILDAFQAVGKTFFVGVQFHPELSATPIKTKRIFDKLLEYASERNNSRN